MSSLRTIRAILVDDEKPARKRLIDLVDREPDIAVVAVCTGGAEAVQAIRARAPDLVFLDIQMPEVDGFGVLEAIGVDRMPVTIFVTAYQQYALQAFDAHAISPNRCDRHGYSSLLPLSSGDRLADDRLRRVGARARRLRALQHRAVGFRSE